MTSACKGGGKFVGKWSVSVRNTMCEMARIIDEDISHAWLAAAKDLGIRVTAPFTIDVDEDESRIYEAPVQDFGGPKGTVVGVVDDRLRDCRQAQGYYCSNLAPSYRRRNPN